MLSSLELICTARDRSTSPDQLCSLESKAQFLGRWDEHGISNIASEETLIWDALTKRIAMVKVIMVMEPVEGARPVKISGDEFVGRGRLRL